MLLLLVFPSLPPVYHSLQSPRAFWPFTIPLHLVQYWTFGFTCLGFHYPHLPLNHTFPSSMWSPSLHRHPLTNSSTHFMTQPTRKGSRQESPNTVAHGYFSVFVLARQPWTQVSSGRVCMHVPFSIVFLFWPEGYIRWQGETPEPDGHVRTLIPCQRTISFSVTTAHSSAVTVNHKDNHKLADRSMQSSLHSTFSVLVVCYTSILPCWTSLTPFQVGPSSSHTVGPMHAGRIFITDLEEPGLLHRVPGMWSDMHYWDVIVERCKSSGAEYVSIDTFVDSHWMFPRCISEKHCRGHKPGSNFKVSYPFIRGSIIHLWQVVRGFQNTLLLGKGIKRRKAQARPLVRKGR